MKSGIHFARASWASCLIVALLLLTGCDVAQQSFQPNGITIQVSNYTIPFDTPERMCGALLVMDTQVAALGASHWNTSNGSRPANVTDVETLTQQGYLIYTPLQLSSPRLYVDYRHQPTSEFATVGGRVGADRYISDGYPQVEVGKRYVLVLIPGLAAPAQGQTEKWLAVAGAFPIDKQEVVTLQAEHSEGKGQQSETVPAVTMPLSKLAQQLANCK